MINVSYSYRVSSHITSKELDGTLYILDPHKGHLHTLNETAQLVWTQIIQKSSVTTIIQSVVNTYQVSDRQAKKDVYQLIERWTKLGIIELVLPRANKISHKKPSSPQHPKRKNQRQVTISKK